MFKKIVLTYVGHDIFAAQLNPLVPDGLPHCRNYLGLPLRAQRPSPLFKTQKSCQSESKQGACPIRLARRRSTGVEEGSFCARQARQVLLQLCRKWEGQVCFNYSFRSEKPLFDKESAVLNTACNLPVSNPYATLDRMGWQ
jgi:hypothetical protein